MNACAFCGADATHERVQIEPAQMRAETIVDRNGLPMPGQRLVRAAVIRDLCDKHYAIWERDQGWQERQRKERVEREAELKRITGGGQLDLFGEAA